MPGQSWACRQGDFLGGTRGMGYWICSCRASGGSKATQNPGEAVVSRAGTAGVGPRVSGVELSGAGWWILGTDTVYRNPLRVQGNTPLAWRKKEKSKHNLGITVLCHCFLTQSSPGGTESCLTAKTKGATVMCSKTSEVCGRLLLPVVSSGSGQGCQEFDTAKVIISRGCFWGNCTAGKTILTLPGFDSMSHTMDALFTFQLLTGHKG